MSDVKSWEFEMAKATARRRGQVDADSILRAALALFAERGYRATTMDDIGSAVGIRGPSLYKHVRSKHDLLVQIMVETMSTLIRDQQAALAAGSDLTTRLRRSVEAHVRYHAAHRLEAFVGNREIESLQSEERERVLELRDSYELRLRALIEAGCEIGEFSVQSARLASYAILEMGIGVATWYRDDGEYGVDEVAYYYSEMALLMVGATTNLSPGNPDHKLSVIESQFLP
jgi:AcrR family transcriptional regulator